MGLTIEPLSPWYQIVIGLAALAALLLLGRGAFDRWQVLGRQPRTRGAVLILSLIAALLFALASLNPYFSSQSNPAAVHLAVVVDVSDSVLRAEGGWAQVHHTASELIQSSVSALSDEVRTEGSASIVTFRSGVTVVERQIPLADLPAAFKRLAPSDFAAGEGSDIGAGLERAGGLLEQAGGGGALLLLSDGNQTEGDAHAAAQHLARRGVPIHVHPIESGGPELAITAANLPRQVNIEVGTFVRGVLRNNGTSEVNVIFTSEQNQGVLDSTSQAGIAQTEERYQLLPDGWARFRQPVDFQGVGLQFLDLSLRSQESTSQAAGEEAEHRRRFFTHVYQPPNILAIGGDNRWAAALPPDAATVTEIGVEAFSTEMNLKKFDAIVISSVAASQFSAGSLAAIAEAVEKEGVGLMVMNGGHHGADEQTETVLMSYTDTPIEPLLPVSSRPRPFMADPPTRQVVILIDASGSMSGTPLEKSKEIALYIVGQLLRPEDYLDLIVFTDGAQHLVENQLMDENGKSNAINQINAVASGGGTDPSQALELIDGRKMTECGLIFISDGEFAPETVKSRPDCRATVFAIGYESVSPNSPLWQLADPFPVGASFDPSSIMIPYFDPQPRDKFFEPGEFAPLTMERFLRQIDRLPVPELPLPGAAITYIKEEADWIAARPKFRDPVLAYQESGNGYVGALTTEVPPAWLEREEGRLAVEAWVTRVVPYLARDRYDFQLTDQGDAIEIQISVIAEGGQAPQISQLTAHIERPDEGPTRVRLDAEPNIPATFNGYIRLERDTETQSATLVLSESGGADALSRPQRVPILIPPAGTLQRSLPREAYSYGLNQPLLQAITQAGGGIFEPPNGTPFFRGKPVERRGQPLWPFLLVAAIVCYLTAIALRRLDP